MADLVRLSRSPAPLVSSAGAGIGRAGEKKTPGGKESLPALVYLRGFLMEYARTLKLDAVQVSRTYLERYQKMHPGGKP